MKKINTFLYFLFALFLVNNSFSQWIAKTITPLDSAGKWVRHFSAPQKDVIWATSRSNIGVIYDQSPSVMFARSLDGGNTWNSGNVMADSNFTFTSIFAVNKDTAFASLVKGVYVGKLVRTFDGGATWTDVSNVFTTGGDCYADWVAFTDPLHGVAFGDPVVQGQAFQIYNTQDGGVTWIKNMNVPLSLVGEIGSTGGSAVYGDTIYTGTNKGRVFKSTDKGLTWSVITTPYPDMYFMDINAKNGHEIIAFIESFNATLSVYEYGYMKSTDGGNTWAWVLGLNANVQGTEPCSNASYITGTYDSYVFAGIPTFSYDFAGMVLSNDGCTTWKQLDATTTFIDAVNGSIWLAPDIGYATGILANGVSQTHPYLLVWNGESLADEQPLVYENTNAYPNPTQDIVAFRTHLLKQTSLEIQLTDVMGNVLESFADASAVGEYEHEFSLKKLPTGIYMIRALIGNQVVLKSVIKQ